MNGLVLENLARDPKVKAHIRSDLCPTIQRIRGDRKTSKETWLRYWRIWSTLQDQEAYRGRNQNYIPVLRRICDMWVQRLMQSFFPNDEWFGVRALRQSVEQRVPLVKALFRYFFDHHMRLRRNARPWCRQLVMLGTSPVKVMWNLQERDIVTLREIFNKLGDSIGHEEEMTRVLDYIGPTFRTVDLFGWYVWPTMVQDVDDATIVFEDMLVAQRTCEELGKKYLDPDDPDRGFVYENIDELLDQLYSNDQRDKIDAERRRMQDKGFTHPVDDTLPTEMKPADITEVTWRTDLDGTGEKRWLVVLGGQDVPLRVHPVPWWHGKSPYLCGKFVEVENEFYGRSLFDSVDKLQYFVNDIANQASDALVWSLNPITVVDMFRIHDPNSLRMRPGAKWLGEPGAVDMKEPPKESAAMGFNALGQLVGIVREAVEPTPPSPPGGTRGRRAQQNAAAQQLAAQEALIPVRDVVELNEDLVFKPLLQMMHSLTWQCLDRDLVLQIASTDGAPLAERKVSVTDVIGDFDFTWLASTSAVNAQVRATQMINYLGIATKIPPQILQQSNIKIDLGYILKTIWTEGFQLPQGDRVIQEAVRKTTIDPRVENDLFRLHRGADVVVSEGDDNAFHRQVHQEILPYLVGDDAMLMQKHLVAHQAAEVTKRLMQIQQQAQQQGLMNAAKPGSGGQPGGNGGPPMTTLNPGRPPSTNDLSDVMRGLPRGNA